MDDHFNGNYKCIQSSYYGDFDFGTNPITQTANSRTMMNLFTDDTISRLGV